MYDTAMSTFWIIVIIIMITVKAASWSVSSRRDHIPKRVPRDTWVALQGARLGPTEFISLGSALCKHNYTPLKPSLPDLKIQTPPSYDTAPELINHAVLSQLGSWRPWDS